MLIYGQKNRPQLLGGGEGGATLDSVFPNDTRATGQAKSMFARWQFSSVLKYLFKTLVAWMIIVGVCVGLTEIFLRYFHDLFPQQISNHLATGYHTGLTGIYRYDRETRRMVMKPNFERHMYFNGYRWHHKTDSMGFRNPTDRHQTDVVLLGDSMVYGHGLEEADTIRHQLEKIIKQPVSNLGQQGGSAHYEYHILKDVGLGLKPRFVLLFFLTNDIHDLTVQLSDEEMRRFIAQQTDITHIDYTTTYPPFGFWPALKMAVSQDVYTLRAIEALKTLLRHVGEAHAASAAWHQQPLFRRNQRLKLAMAFHLDALKKMHAIAHNNNSILVNVFMYTAQAQYAEEEPVYEQILQGFCQSEHIPFLNLRPVFSHDNEGEPLFLKNDGHFSSRGARVVAEVLGAYLESRPSQGLGAM